MKHLNPGKCLVDNRGIRFSFRGRYWKSEHISQFLDDLTRLLQAKPIVYEYQAWEGNIADKPIHNVCTGSTAKEFIESKFSNDSIGVQLWNCDEKIPLQADFYLSHWYSKFKRNGAITHSLPPYEAKRVFEKTIESFIPLYAFFVPVETRQTLDKALYRNFKVNSYGRTSPGDIELASALSAKLPRLYSHLTKHPIHPEMIGWLNYWSPESREYLELNDLTELKQNVYSVTKFPDDGIYVQLTEKPLDLYDQGHVERVVWCYDYLNRIGERKE